jgi:hypothetical protein
MTFQGIGIGEGRVRDGSGVEALHNNDDDSRTLDNGAGRKVTLFNYTNYTNFSFSFLFFETWL